MGWFVGQLCRSDWGGLRQPVRALPYAPGIGCRCPPVVVEEGVTGTGVSVCAGVALLMFLVFLLDSLVVV